MNQQELFELLDAALPGRVFEALAPQGTGEPYVVYSLVNDQESNTLCGTAELGHELFRVDVYAASRKEARAIYALIKAAIDGCEGDPIINDRQDMYESDTRINRVSAVLSTWS
jgi:hypothetical protein